MKKKVARRFKKVARRIRTKPKKAYRMARRRYNRKSRGHSRGVSVSLTDVGYLAAVMVEVGIPTAIKTAQTSGIGDAITNLGKSFTVQKAVNLGLTTGVYALVKKVLPSRNLISFGRFHIKN